MRFHELTGTYQDTNLDPQLLWVARRVSESIGHGADPARTREGLAAIGFEVFGSGSGGYSVYRLLRDDKIITLHVTPYGPSILDEMPRFILLERRSRFYMETLLDEADANILDAATPREAKVRGFTYSGAFFQSQEWASLKYRFDRELQDYGNACRIAGTEVLPRTKRNPQEAKSASPPTDLQSLKNFIRGGRLTFKQWRDNSKWKQIQRQVGQMSRLVARYQRGNTAPKRVILYLEGLDCSGKSSTGGLICQALEECGYSVVTAQHNRPPTAEQRKKPWMDRGRFEYPQDLYESEDGVPEYASVVWDRGPAGDFVYGTLHELPMAQKLERYSEFRRYDYGCRADGVLFIKCFFVTDRDSIAKTLGKRLAHKKIARDLRTWLDANSAPHAREGLDEIEMHIDPTDFVAFNKYEENLHKFSEFARNTDYVGNVGDHGEDSLAGYSNPWLVVNTSDRHSARLNLMKAFVARVHSFAALETAAPASLSGRILAACGFRRRRQPARASEVMLPAVPDNIVEEREHGLSIRAVLQSFVLLLLFFAYAHQTWNFTLDDVT
jgi:polyphosphate kinase 2 (PPK2 family)